MNSLKEFLNNFFNNKGHFVFLSFLIAKICGFLSSIVIIKLLPENEFGILSIVLSVFAIFLPFAGLGSNQILLRYGSLHDDEDKRKLSSYLFFKGFFYEIVLVAIFIGFSMFYMEKYDDILTIFLFCGVRLFGFYFLNHIQTFYRITGRNNIFARINNVNNIGGFILLFLLTYYWGFYGYLTAMALMPFSSLFWLKKEMFSFKKSLFPNTRELWRFGIFTAFTSVISETLFSLDILLLSFLMNETAVANYKVAILLPSNIPFLAISFMQSDYPRLTKNHKDKAFLTSYLRNYYKLFFPICIFIFGFFYFFKTDLLQLFFGKTYIENGNLLMILLFGFCFGMLSRNIYGNLLPAVGKIEINTWVSAISLLLLTLISFQLVKEFGLIGMGISLTTILVWEGLIYFFFFTKYLKSL